MEAVAPDEGPEKYEFLIQVEVIRNENITVKNKMKQVSYWIGFWVASSQKALIEDAFGSLNDVMMRTEKEKSTMASNFSSRTQASGRMNFGTRKIKNIKAFTH